MNFIVECAGCGASYAAPLVGPGATCGRCGAPLPQALPRPADAGLRRRAGEARPEGMAGGRDEARREEAKMRELQRLADRLCFLIVATDTPRVDVDIQRAALRRRCSELFPDKMHVFYLVYESRFRRLWDQFRAA